MSTERIALWLDTRCSKHPRVAGGLNTLLRNFNDWSKDVVFTRGAFVELLEEQGFKVVEIEHTRLVMGLSLKEDVEIYLGASSPATGRGKEVAR